ncbi:MAG TPA: formimidoylglutamate deiminase [Thermoanaerobaculia bacterium]|nr:formimidoylglutamate deiminase [Thermoanaerobaculia bacterium]
MSEAPIAQVLEADLTFLYGRFEAGVQVALDEEGRIRATGKLGLAPTRTFPAQALLPGFVNAHSHAFQRGLRGLGESFPAGAGSFWTWREAMYDLAGSLDGDAFETLCGRAFEEMRSAGITSVGEFHYLHHESELDFAFDERILAAAAKAEIRIVLLLAYYRTGGIGRPLAPGQRRFETPDLESYWRQVDRLSARLDPARQSLGIVAHSIRAASPEEIASLHGEARRRGLPFHLHAEEQQQEIADCQAAYGRGPLALLSERLNPGPFSTAVHATHSTSEDLARWLGPGARICLCPLTEANLGDGIADLPTMARWPDQLCLGTDSNARISMLEEMRWLEYGQRLSGERRGVLTDGDGEVAPFLLRAATANGAASLGLAAGEIAPGRWGDLVLVDLEHPSLAGATPRTLLAALVFGGGDEVIVETAVGGRFRRHRD